MAIENKRFMIYKCLLVFLFIHSMYPWFTMEIEIVTFFLVLVPFFYVVNQGATFYEKTPGRKYALCAFTLLNLWMARGGSPFAYVQALGCSYIIGSVIFLKDEYKVAVIDFITKVFAIILGVSIIGYLAFLSGVNIPYSLVEYRTYSIQNYYFFLAHWGNFFRFQGPFLEPGHLTMGLAPLLYINRYNFRDKYVFILLLAQILTLSLAGYITLVLGFSMQMLFDEQGSHGRIKTVILAVVFTIGAMGVLNSVFGENILEEKIFSRLEWDGEKLVGDDRSSDMLDFEYNKTIQSDSKWTGDNTFDQTTLEKGVAGYKLFIVQQGLFGLFIAILAYFFSLTSYATSKKKPVVLLLVMIISLLIQNAYPIWWCIIICAFIGGTKLLKNESLYER